MTLLFEFHKENNNYLKYALIPSHKKNDSLYFLGVLV